MCEIWLKRNTRQAVLLANTLHDLLKGQIVGNPNYLWLESRKFIFSEDGKATKKDAVSERRGATERVGLPYEGEGFEWHSGERLPETKPLTSGQKPNATPALTSINRELEKYDESVTLGSQSKTSSDSSDSRTRTAFRLAPLKDRARPAATFDTKEFDPANNEGLSKTGSRKETHRRVASDATTSYVAELTELADSDEDWEMEMHRRYLSAYHQELAEQGHYICARCSKPP